MFSIKLFTTFALFALAYASCPGCPEKTDVNSPQLLKHLKLVLKQQNSNEEIVKVLSATSQIVAGVKYNVEFMTVNQDTKVQKICSTEYVVQSWISEEPQILSYQCKQQRKFNLESIAFEKEVCAGCPTKHDPKEYDVTEHLQKVLLSQNSDDKVTKVISVTTQVVSGVLYTVEFESQNPKTNAKHICKTEFLTQPWISKLPQVMSFKCVKSVQKRSLDEHAEFKQVCAGCPTKHDPKEYDVTEQLQKVLLSQNSDDKVTKVISVTTQVVSGVKYTVEFESQNPTTNAKHICKTEFISQPWISKLPQVMSFKCVKSVQKRSVDELAVFKQVCAGCPTKHDPKEYDVSEHLQKVLLSQNSDDKVTKVISVTTQVVSGVKYTVEFESQNPTTNAKHICKTEFVTQPWISKLPQVMSFKCVKSVQKRSLDEHAEFKQICAGCPTKHDPKEYDVTEQLQKVLLSQNSDDKVTKVISVTTQVVSGVKYTVEFESQNPTTNAKHICKTEFISQPWISKLPQVMSFKCVKSVQKISLDELAVFKQICAGCPTKHDPKEYDVTEHLQKVLMSQNSDDKVTKVISITTQVVSGVKYTVEFESQNPTTNAKHICKTEFVTQPWLSKIPQVLKFQCSPLAPLMESVAEFYVSCPGCESEQDPKSFDVVPMLKTVMASQNSDDKIVKVTKISTQVVSGIKYTVEFETENVLKNIFHKCKTEFVEAPWESKIPQVMSYKCV